MTRRHGVFVNYRVGDRETEAAMIADVLRRRLGEKLVFFASRSLRPGQDFAQGLENGVKRSSVLLAVVGPRWVDARSAAGKRRLDDPDDWVRREIAEALTAGTEVIPMLIGDRREVPVLTPDVLPDQPSGGSHRHPGRTRLGGQPAPPLPGTPRHHPRRLPPNLRRDPIGEGR